MRLGVQESKKIALFRRRMLAFFRAHGRDLPWRHTADPYAITISEIMLQQTQVDRVIPKYRAFLQKFPTWRALARATPATVLSMWQGLGYNRRALMLHRLAQAVDENGYPVDVAHLEKLPGLGPYTARAVAAFAYRQRVAPVDVNIARVLRRVFGLSAVSAKEMQTFAETIVPTDAWSYNHAMMDFGATVCTARKPNCAACPLRDICAAYPCDGSDVVKKSQEKFTESDRYFRGRIVDVLRARDFALSALIDRVGLGHDETRFDRIMLKLQKEGLVVVRRGKVGLPR